MRAADIADALRDVYDPELGLDVVSLGLIYGIHVEGRKVRVRMTLTSAGCPMAGAMIESTELALRYQFPDADVAIATDFDPPWDIDMADDRARDWLGEPPRRATRDGAAPSHPGSGCPSAAPPRCHPPPSPSGSGSPPRARTQPARRDPAA